MTIKKMRELKQRMIDVGPAIPGTIREVYLRCGRSNCSCKNGKPSDKHGPYYLWDHKRNGRLTSVSITQGDVAQFQEWIENRRRLEALLQEVFEEGAEEARRRKSNSQEDGKKRSRSSTRSD